MKSYKFVLVNGFGWSGSSALVDFFREFDVCYVPQKEFRLIKDPHGLRDLDLQINNSTDALNEDTAIKDFIRFIKIYSRINGGFRPLGLGYSKDFGQNIEKITREFIDGLIAYKYTGYWWYLDMDTPYLKYTTKRILGKTKIYDHKEHTKMYLSTISEDEFVKKAKTYIDNIFGELLQNTEYETVVLDQAIPANRPSWGMRYFNNSRVLIVDRDPRDVYVDLIKEKSLVGYDVAINHDVNLFIEWFKKVRRLDPIASNHMRIQFEDLIQNYESVVKSIYDYCELSPQLHTHKKKRLIPDESCKNIGMWKEHPYPDEIRKIEHDLKDYLVQ